MIVSKEKNKTYMYTHNYHNYDEYSVTTTGKLYTL